MLLAEMFDRKQNILLTKMLNTHHQTWCAKRFNIVELTNVRSFSRGLSLQHYLQCMLHGIRATFSGMGEGGNQRRFVQDCR